MSQEERMAQIAGNLLEVQSRIRAACLRAGRNPSDVTLIAVSKTRPYEDVICAYEAGARAFGENYVQELTGKLQAQAAQDPEKDIQWHMIGHLQKNKVKYLIGKVALIHSVDSIELAQVIEREAAKKDAVMDILMEVNAAEEETKWGFTLDNAEEAARAIAGLPHVRLRGIMTSAPYTENPESNRPYFHALNRLAEHLDIQGLIEHDGAAFPKLPILSMGMSGDYEVAVEEGATMVRVGTSIFGERDYAH